MFLFLWGFLFYGFICGWRFWFDLFWWFVFGWVFLYVLVFFIVLWLFIVLANWSINNFDVMLKVNPGDGWPSNGSDCNGLLYSWVEIPFTKSNGPELISLNQLLYIHTPVVLWLLGVKVSAILNCLRHLQVITRHTMIEERAFS